MFSDRLIKLKYSENQFSIIYVIYKHIHFHKISKKQYIYPTRVGLTILIFPLHSFLFLTISNLHPIQISSPMTSIHFFFDLLLSRFSPTFYLLVFLEYRHSSTLTRPYHHNLFSLQPCLLFQNSLLQY